MFKQYLTKFYTQVLEPITDAKEKQEILQAMQFLKPLTSLVLNNLGDYHDTVRDESQELLIFVTERFMPPLFSKDQDLLDIYKILKATI
jgi:hypothetical protein